MSSSIFISYSSSDQKVAETICDALQARGFACWISCRDIGPGENFQESIVKAIRAAKLMLLVFTSNANNSNEIKKEIVLAGRYHLTVVPVRVEDVVPNDALAYEFATRQWIDLFNDWERDIERLVSQIGSILAEGSSNGDKGVPIIAKPVPQAPVVKKPPLRRFALLALPAIALAIGGAYLYWRPAASPPLLTPAAAPEATADDRACRTRRTSGQFRRSSNIWMALQMGVTSRRHSNESGQLTIKPGRMPSVREPLLRSADMRRNFPMVPTLRRLSEA